MLEKFDLNEGKPTILASFGLKPFHPDGMLDAPRYLPVSVILGQKNQLFDHKKYY